MDIKRSTLKDASEHGIISMQQVDVLWAFWGGLLMMHSDNELNKFIYFCINLGMIVVGTILSRRVFANLVIWLTMYSKTV